MFSLSQIIIRVMNGNLYYDIYLKFYPISVGALFNYVRIENFNIKTLGYLTYMVEILHKTRRFLRKISYNQKESNIHGRIFEYVYHIKADG